MQRPEQKTAAGAAEVAKEWLEKSASNSRGLTAEQIWRGGGFVHSVSLSGLSVSHCAGGRVVASFRVPPHLTDEEGNWHAGAIATLIDDVGAAAIMTVIGHIKISVDFSISYFSPAKINEEVEIDARMIEHKGGKGKLTAVTIEVRKKGSASLVAVGRQWMASSRPDQRYQVPISIKLFNATSIAVPKRFPKSFSSQGSWACSPSPNWEASTIPMPPWPNTQIVEKETGIQCFNLQTLTKKGEKLVGGESEIRIKIRIRNRREQEQMMSAERAKQWLEEVASLTTTIHVRDIFNSGGGLFSSVSLSTLSVSHSEMGRILCSFRIPHHLTDGEGNWHAGAIATLIDNVGAAAIMTVVGHIKISVDFSISYFSPAKINEEVEIDARMVEHKGGMDKLTAVTVEVRKKGSPNLSLVAVGRQWMASPRPGQWKASPRPDQQRSNL